MLNVRTCSAVLAAGATMLGLLCSTVPARAADEAVPPAVKELSQRGVLAGYPEGKFEPNKPVTRLEMAVILARLLRVIEATPNAAQPAQPPKPQAKQPPLPAGIPQWARGEFAYLSQRGYTRDVPALCKDLQKPVRQQDLVNGLVWALSSAAERGFIAPGDLAPPPKEPEPVVE